MLKGSVFDPWSPQASSVSGLMVLSFVALSLIFVLVAGLITTILLRSRGSTHQGEPPQVFGNVRLETGWTFGALAAVAILFALTVPVLRDSHPAEAAESGEPDLVVTGHQWWWEARYPDGIVTANEIHVPLGKRLLVALESADVIHDFWVPQLGPKQDTMPGRRRYVWLEPTQAGSYEGACAEFCGNEHAWMRIKVVAESPADFAAWRQRMAAAPALAGAGEQIFNQYACNSCHAVSGQGARVAPDLTHLEERKTLGSGVLENTPANLALWLKDPQAIKPECNMPNFNLTSEQIDALVVYLDGKKP